MCQKFSAIIATGVIFYFLFNERFEIAKFKNIILTTYEYIHYIIFILMPAAPNAVNTINSSYDEFHGLIFTAYTIVASIQQAVVMAICISRVVRELGTREHEFKAKEFAWSIFAIFALLLYRPIYKYRPFFGAFFYDDGGFIFIIEAAVRAMGAFYYTYAISEVIILIKRHIKYANE